MSKVGAPLIGETNAMASPGHNESPNSRFWQQPFSSRLMPKIWDPAALLDREEPQENGGDAERPETLDHWLDGGGRTSVE